MFQLLVSKAADKFQGIPSPGSRFLPFSAETTGGLGKDAEELIDQISLACRDHLALPSHYHIANAVRASIAIAVQKGNALAIFGGYSRCNGAVYPARHVSCDDLTALYCCMGSGALL